MKNALMYLAVLCIGTNILFGQDIDNTNFIEETNRIYDVRPIQHLKTELDRLSFPLSVYPTYSEYAKQMQQFETDNPTIVDMFSIGKTEEGDKDILFVKITDNVNENEQEPKILLTSSMHGDELTGYPMMLTLIDYIIKAYQTEKHPDHDKIKNLVDNTEIWINPNANPDGTYHGCDNNKSVVNARRENANNVDLNRNYPDNKYGAHPDDNNYQKETLHFLELAENNHFVLSANLHGGAELINYPFDNTLTNEYTHPDGNWFEFVAYEYASTAQKDANSITAGLTQQKKHSNYMFSDEDYHIYPSPGVTHGAEWYLINGSRQDFMNYYHQCKEITIELSNVKIVPESELAHYWHYNKNALINFLTQGTFGFRGYIKDIENGQPIEATITILNHDNFGSHTVSSMPYGDFYRPIAPGTYDLMIEAPNYQSVVLKNERVDNYTTKELPVIYLSPLRSTMAESLVNLKIRLNDISVN